MPFPAYYETCLIRGLQAIGAWEKQWPPVEPDATLDVDSQALWPLLQAFTERLRENYPFFHPLYAGQMLKPPHPVAMLGYFLAMQINPNNHALDGGPATARMEKECIDALGAFYGYQTPLGHLTSSGTIANLEALWVARELHPDKAVAFSDQAHYTHGRMGEVLRVDTLKVPSIPQGRLDLEALEGLLKTRAIGTVVVTLGTTSLGALDPLAEVLALKETYGFRIHVDAAYGGFYRVLAQSDPAFRVFELISRCDSLVVDPHKHGLQPYGCGCVLFQDPAVGRFYRHDSPYTYFSSDDLHLGEISLECSRPGAAAAALWLTLQCFPLEADRGFGPVLQKTRQAALAFARTIEEGSAYHLYLEPELDIVTYFPRGASTSQISQKTEAIFEQAMASHTPWPVYLAKLRVPAAHFKRLHPSIDADTPEVVLFRSCLMKPEHLDWVPHLADALNRFAAQGQAVLP